MFLRRKFVAPEAEPLSELEDIERNLLYVFSTKQGCGSFLRDYGITETGFKTPAHMLVEMSVELRKNIELYEPRLEVIKIEDDFNHDTQQAFLVVKCRLRSAEQQSLHLKFVPGDSLPTVFAPGEG